MFGFVYLFIYYKFILLNNMSSDVLLIIKNK